MTELKYVARSVSYKYTGVYSIIRKVSHSQRNFSKKQNFSALCFLVSSPFFLSKIVSSQSLARIDFPIYVDE